MSRQNVVVYPSDEWTWGGASLNWLMLSLGLVGLIGGLALAWWMRRLGVLTSGSTDSLDWHGGLVVGGVLGICLAAMGAIFAAVAYVILLAHGWLTAWSLLLPAAGIAYGIRRVNAWAAARIRVRR